MDEIKSLSRHKIGRYGENIVFNALKGSLWANGDFDATKQHDLTWEGFKIDVNASSIRKNTGFVFSNSSGYRKDVVNIFVGLDDKKNFFWVRKGLSKKGFYGKIRDAIGVEDLPSAVRK